MPIGHFTRAMAGDLTYVSTNGHFDEEKAVRAWEKLFNQHIKQNGLPEAFIDYMKRMDKAMMYYDKAYNHGKRWLLVKARIYEQEAKQLLSGESEAIEITCARISKFLGFAIRANQCSVTEFYSYVKLMS